MWENKSKLSKFNSNLSSFISDTCKRTVLSMIAEKFDSIDLLNMDINSMVY